MLIPNPKILELSKEYWGVGRGYRELVTKYLAGKKDGLWSDVAKTRSACLRMRENVLTWLREELAPTEEPAAE